MPKRSDIQSILVIGAGPIIIGQACEFDYSGTQACQTLRSEGYRVILINSNPATIMTDPQTANVTYIEPLRWEIVARVIERERPDALLPTMGGQTALNIAFELDKRGILERFGVTMIGAQAKAIAKAESRDQFNAAMTAIGLDTVRGIVVHSVDEAMTAGKKIGLPLVIRPSFTLGGAGGGFADNWDDLARIAGEGLRLSPEGSVLIEESIAGWKEYELEVVRDHKDNAIIVCSIENIDPMGIHTGDSITVAPALTLTDKEYQIMRSAALAVLREIGVETGGSNVQFAVNPKNGRMIIIEMNPRVSRSSALASKATGFPIAKIAALLALGYSLDELDNDVTKITPASFEPTLDYIVTKIPRFAFEKFPSTKADLGTSMKSVGEAMALGRNFCESLQKALRSLDIGLDGLETPPDLLDLDPGSHDYCRKIREGLQRKRPDRLLVIAQALRAGFDIPEIAALTGFDPWFIHQIQTIVDTENQIIKNGLAQSKDQLQRIKGMGFSNTRLKALGAKLPKVLPEPVFKRVDSCAAEFPALTPYLYSTFNGSTCEAVPSNRAKAAIIGGGPNRIGQGIEFDYCCVHAALAMRDIDVESIMINCNPETVSTDYDTSDRLYFEPLCAEETIAILRREAQNGDFKGAIVQLGGQTPLKLCHALCQAGIPILGTSPEAIDLAEDRQRFQAMLKKLKLRQPVGSTVRTLHQALAVVEEIGFPIVIRPSYVLGGRAMEILYDHASLARYMDQAVEISQDKPVLIDSYLEKAIELDVDALSDGQDVYVAGIMEHIERAGVHSGDSACSLPSRSIKPDMLAQVERQTTILAKAFNIVGLLNIQFAVKDDTLYILEVNPRASRTVPFVAKVTNVPLAGIATKIMLGSKLADFDLKRPQYRHVAVKEAVFPFARFPESDVLLGPEMKSTGEVMGLDKTFDVAFAKAQMENTPLPQSGVALISVAAGDKTQLMITILRRLNDMGFTFVATHGTADWIKSQGFKVRPINKVRQGSPHVVDWLNGYKAALVINTTSGAQSVADSFSLRRAAFGAGVPYSTTVSGAEALIDAIAALKNKVVDIKPLQHYFLSTLKV